MLPFKGFLWQVEVPCSKNFPKMNWDNLSGTTPNKGLENDADIATNPPQRSQFFFYWIQMLMTSMNDAY